MRAICDSLHSCRSRARVVLSVRRSKWFPQSASASSKHGSGLKLRIFVDLDCAPGFVSGVTDILQQTIHTFRPPRRTQLASMPDDLVRERNPLFTRDDFHQILFNLYGIGVLRQLESARDASYVRVDHYAFGFAKPRAQHDVGCLARDARQGEKLSDVIRHLSSEFADQ